MRIKTLGVGELGGLDARFVRGTGPLPSMVHKVAGSCRVDRGGRGS